MPGCGTCSGGSRPAAFFHTLPDPVVHRDLKPLNALTDARGRVRVTDFGIGAVAARQALLLDRRGQMTSGGRLQSYLRGSHTPLYASPEQKAGADPDPRDDVHALGVIAYQLYTGRLDRAPGARFDRELQAAGAPPALAELIGDCVDPEQHHRPKDGAELAERLKGLGRAGGSVREGEAPAEPPSPVSAPARQEARPPVPAPAVHVAPPARKGGDEVHFPLPHGLKMTFCWVPPGTCQLGSNLAEQNAVIKACGGKQDWLSAESQARRGAFTTTGFWLGKYPVTQDEWHSLTGENPSYFQAGSGGMLKVKGLDTTRFPVENVSWDMCQTYFLPKLNATRGVEAFFGRGAKPFRLPHEDEWEYAARGGHADGRPFYWGWEIDGTQANIYGGRPFGTASKGPYLERLTVVGQYAAKAPHPWGLCDLHGNLREWCHSNRDDTSDFRFLRGGSWCDSGVDCRAAYCFKSEPDFRCNDRGLRVLLPVDG